jgi:prepilin-type N-terminal cleavage/methylation domain-containing protein
MVLAATHRRAGFTLLEVLLASAISLLLLAALYLAFDLTLQQADVGREAVQRGDIARAVTNRITIDLAGCIGPMPPRSGGGIPEDQIATTASGSSTTETGSASGSSSSESTATAAATAAATATGTNDLAQSEAEASVDLPFRGGLFGSESQVTLFVSKVPPALAEAATSANAGDPRADLRRVTYYFVPNKGLCRQEKPWVTAPGIRDSVNPVGGEEDADVLSEDVKSVSFSYFDGTAWASEWTGSDGLTDGKSVKGPPRAIKITMTIQAPGMEQPKTVTHVVMVRAAIGLAPPPPEEDETITDPTTATTP